MSLYQVTFTNDLTGKPHVEYVEGRWLDAEMRAELKLFDRIQGGFIQPPFSKWTVERMKMIDAQDVSPERIYRAGI